MDKDIIVSVVLPCLNEAGAIEDCINAVHAVMREHHLLYEVVVCDNGSTDGSADLAERAGARVVVEPRRGYGSAYLAGLAAARGRWLILADADGTYDFNTIPEFIKHLERGAELVMGNRFAGVMDERAMPWLHRYVGNPVLSALVRAWFRVSVRDVHCGMRAIARSAYERLRLQTRGMEFASEMIVRAGREGLITAEVPLNYRQRIGISKLRTWRDGWRHLRFMLLFAPTVVFFLPGMVFIILGLVVLLPMSVGPLRLGSLVLNLHPMFGASLLVVLGVQVMGLGIFTKLLATRSGFERPTRLVAWWLKRVTLERLLLVGLLVAAVGGGIFLVIIWRWAQSGFGGLFAVRPLVLALTLLVVGFQIMFASFFSGWLTLYAYDYETDR